MKKWLKITSLSVLGLIVVAGVLTWIEFGSIIQGTLSAKKLDDGMYQMEYKGDDGFVAVEYVDNKMVVTETPFVTNHYLCEEKFQVGLHESDHRHEKLMEQYEKAAIEREVSQAGLGLSEREQARPGVKAGGVMSEKELTDAIVSVTQLPEKDAIVGGTLWTMVMDLAHPSVTYYSRRHFDKPFRFELKRQKDL